MSCNLYLASKLGPPFTATDLYSLHGVLSTSCIIIVINLKRSRVRLIPPRNGRVSITGGRGEEDFFSLKTFVKLLTTVNPIRRLLYVKFEMQRSARDGSRRHRLVFAYLYRIRSNPSARNAMRIKIPFEYLAHILSVIYNA